MPAMTDSWAPRLADPATYGGDLAERGPVPTMIEAQSMTSGVLIHKGPDGGNECGLRVCTPGYWDCHVTHDEFCHFLAGCAIYTHESGEIIEVEPDTAAFFPAGWKGFCRVPETVPKLYMIG